MKKKLDHLLKEALEKCFRAGTLKETSLPAYVIEVPGHPDHGHFATNLPLVLASSQGKRPRDLATLIVENLEDREKLIRKVDIAGPGFINFTMALQEWQKLLGDILNLGSDYGRSAMGAGDKVLVEFVSANPTGPLHLGHGRGAALGDTLCRILAFTGYEVVREFYINDAGRQVHLLGESVYSRWKQMSDPGYPYPENGYHAEYVVDLAKEISRQTNLEALTAEQAIAHCAQWAKGKMLEEIKRDLGDFRVAFDVWSSESELYTSGLIDKTLEALRIKGDLYEEDKALWIRTSSFGDDKDRVIRKSDGQYTYFAPDIAYHIEKWKRGFTKAINIWGADHHGYVRRMKAALKTTGIHEDWLSVLLLQLVKLWRGGQEVKMSKRAGLYVTLRELVEEVGVDSARFVFLTKHHDSALDFDIDLVKKQDADNPVYYVQYAHARISSIFRKAASEGLDLPIAADTVLGNIVLDEETALIRLMADFPPLLEEIARTLEPHRLTYYLAELASLFHKYFNLGTKDPEKRIVGQDQTLSQARLCLAEGVRIVLLNGLRLLGIDAPERM